MKNNTPNMKLKLLLLSIFFISSFNLFSQNKDTLVTAPTVTPTPPPSATPTPSPTLTKVEDKGLLKNVRFGLQIAPSINYFKVLNKKASNGKPLGKISGGLLLEFKITEAISFQTGLGINLDGGKISYTNDFSSAEGSINTRYFYNKTEEDILAYDNKYRNNSGYREFILISRKYSHSFVSIPLNLRMKTSYYHGNRKKSNKLRYFGQIGFDLQIATSRLSASDLVREVSYDQDNNEVINSTEIELNGITTKKDISALNIPLNLGLGIEKKISETNAILFSLNLYPGFVSVLNAESKYMVRATRNTSNSADFTSFKQDVNSRRLAFNIGFLF